VAKGHIKGSLALSLEDSAGRMNRIGRSHLIHGEVLSYSEVVARTEAVTHDDLRRVADRIFGNERVLAVVGPFSEDDFSARVA
jgi:predicted Zn-dependent peptidase